MEYEGNLSISAENIEIHSKSSVPCRPGSYVKLSFKDDGPGIKQEIISRIFDPYFTTKAKGSGLGLASSLSIIRNHHGHITVQSEPGKGAVFSIYLPSSPGKSIRKKQKSEVISGSGRILLMDDDEMVLEAITIMLEDMGYSVDAVSDGNQVISMYKERMSSKDPYRVVILDLTVPGGQGGKAVLRELKRIDPGVKAIVASGYSTDKTLLNYRAEGFSGLINKPINYEKLSRLLHQIINQ